jgi:hypothetical protein
MKFEAAGPSETLALLYETKQPHTPEGSNQRLILLICDFFFVLRMSLEAK